MRIVQVVNQLKYWFNECAPQIGQCVFQVQPLIVNHKVGGQTILVIDGLAINEFMMIFLKLGAAPKKPQEGEIGEAMC